MKWNLIRLIILLFFSLPYFLSAMENGNTNDLSMEGRRTYIGSHSGQRRFEFFSPPNDGLEIDDYYQIEGIWYKYRGYNDSLNGHAFYKNDDEQVILNQDNNGTWIITKECTNKEGNFISVGEIRDNFYNRPLPLSASFTVCPATLGRCLLQNTKYGFFGASVLAAFLLLRWYLTSRRRGPLLRIDPKTGKVMIQKKGTVRIKRDVCPE